MPAAAQQHGEGSSNGVAATAAAAPSTTTAAPADASAPADDATAARAGQLPAPDTATGAADDAPLSELLPLTRGNVRQALPRLLRAFLSCGVGEARRYMAIVDGLYGFSGGGGGDDNDSSVLFQLRAEADLIGLHLMAQAGFDPRKAPATFERLEEDQARMMGKAAAGASFLQDHPRSASRVRQQLQQELEQLLAARGDDAAHDRVLIRLPYFML